jgi:F-type H+-transporting ATPase subunit gamma
VTGGTQGLRRRITGARDLETVVHSMKALAASSVGQYERAVAALDDYRRTVELGLSACLRQPVSPGAAAPVPRRKGSGRSIGAVVFGSDQGLVGRFNEILAEFSERTLRALPDRTARIWAIGERVHALLADDGPVEAEILSVPISVDAITPLVGRILVEVAAARDDGDVFEIHIFHNRPLSAATYEPVGKRLLPLDASWQRALVKLPWPSRNLPQVIEGATPALQAFIREYLFVVLFQACAESLASENASRLAAMQRAEKNIDGVLDDLNRTFHRVRQESIDEELFDVIAGYEALAPR